MQTDEDDARPMRAAARLSVLALAAVLAGLVYALPLPGIPEAGRRMSAVMIVVVTLWLAEVLPLAVTALLGPALAVLVGVATAEQAFAAFGNPIIMLFIGSFLIARVTFKHGLSERIAYRVLSLPLLGNSPTRAFVMLGLTTAALSAWMSNTAVTAMMLPIAQSVLLAMLGGERDTAPKSFAAAFVLIVTYSASVGGLFTPVGTPPNLIGIGLIEQATGTRIGFGEWIVAVLPVTLIALLVMMAYLAFTFRADARRLVFDRAQMVARYAALGAWRPVERRVVLALAVTALLWILPPVAELVLGAPGAWLVEHLPESIVPLLVAVVLFWVGESRTSARPILALPDLAAIDWPVVVLFGGGMCLGHLMTQSGMAHALGTSLAAYVPAGNSSVLVFVCCLLAIAVSETTSNTASANMVVPVVIAVSQQVGADAVSVGIAATAACTFGFMLPVSTPTNAMAFSTGFVTQRQMIRYGVVLDIVGIALLSAWFGWVVR
ncbi:MAG: DASS family sodium-coupled anion symporter [bacterium]